MISFSFFPLLLNSFNIFTLTSIFSCFRSSSLSRSSSSPKTRADVLRLLFCFTLDVLALTVVRCVCLVPEWDPNCLCFCFCRRRRSELRALEAVRRVLVDGVIVVCGLTCNQTKLYTYMFKSTYYHVLQYTYVVWLQHM